jgi:Chaperone of endosialidase/Head domain of trimeric autotransporter adhesin
MKKIVLFLLILVSYKVVTAQYVGIGTNSPLNQLQVNGSFLVTKPVISTNAAPAPAQMKTMINASTISFFSGDSTGRIYDPGGPAGNYIANLTANASIFSGGGVLAIEITAESMDLGTGDSLFIRENSFTPTNLLAVGNGYTTTGKWVFSKPELYIVFKSNGDAGVGSGFSLLFRKLYDNSASLPDVSGMTGYSMFFDTKTGAFRSGTISTTTLGAASVAMGNGPTASGLWSVALGSFTTASGQRSTAMGEATTAGGINSTAMGNNTNAGGTYSTAMGSGTSASGSGAVAMGVNTTASGDYATAMGNFTDAAANYATAIGRNTTASGTYSTAMGYLTTATGVGSTAIGESTNAGGTRSTAMGYSTTASGALSTAMGDGTNAGGTRSTAMGYLTTASGFQSTTMGHSTNASGINSTAMGFMTNASGDNSTAMGFDTESSGRYAAASGLNTISRGYAGSAVGMFNTPILATAQVGVNSTTPLFIVGNGDDDANRSNAMVVRKDGNVGIGTDVPASNLHIRHASGGGLTLENSSDNNKWRIYSASGDNNLTFYNNANAEVADIDDVTGAYTAISDSRLKKNIEGMKPVLPLIMKLNPSYYQFNWQQTGDQRQIGFLAQETYKLFPELVSYSADKDLYKMNYAGFSTVAIKAIQEQQTVIQQQQQKIDMLEQRLQKLEAFLQTK